MSIFSRRSDKFKNKFSDKRTRNDDNIRILGYVKIYFYDIKNHTTSYFDFFIFTLKYSTYSRKNISNLKIFVQ